ncbi:hypothetical protein CJ030_MR3G025378 [Morella rubra]|uniref:Protein kinase domain-containing protein n=1 Tax=Morella rubra TaxID=262757 RepID=A0A6A1W6T8_9ROSI|nr:hypothetical protein CJ030_MR3G025378 [Morella rubra]
MVGAQDASTDKQALLFFKSRIVKEPWGALSKWNLNRVLYLELPSFGLNGTLAPQLLNLTSLKFLDLFNNSFFGPIPPELGDLSRLSVLDLSRNKLSGAIPATCGYISTLTILGLTENQLSGEIPTELGCLQNLLELQLSLLIPYAKQPCWETAVRYRRFSSLLTELYLTSNKLEGPIPSSLSNASQLQVLELSSNGFTGSIPLLGKLKNLTWLHLGNNSLSSTTELNFQTIGSLANCTLMEKLMLESNQLAGQLPVSVGNLSAHLLEFCVDDNFLTGAFPQGLEKYRKLPAISINHNHFKGKIPSSIGKLKQLQRFMVHDNEHRNLVKVFTSCSSIDHRGADFKALVMEFMSNGNLDKWLYPEDIECGSTLTLTQRLSIAIDVASALDYLHHDCDPPVVHCDLKPRNVLLNDDMAAHVGDFGLARVWSGWQPFYHVYSFGILLLEMFTAKKPTDEMFKEGLTLNKFASTVDEKKIRDIADQRLFKERKFPAKHQTNYFTGKNRSSSTDNNSNRDCLNRSEECVAAVIRLGLPVQLNHLNTG